MLAGTVGASSRKYFIRLHESPWNEDSIISDEFLLKKTEADISRFDLQNQFDRQILGLDFLLNIYHGYFYQVGG